MKPERASCSCCCVRAAQLNCPPHEYKIYLFNFIINDDYANVNDFLGILAKNLCILRLSLLRTF